MEQLQQNVGVMDGFDERWREERRKTNKEWAGEALFGTGMARAKGATCLPLTLPVTPVRLLLEEQEHGVESKSSQSRKVRGN